MSWILTIDADHDAIDPIIDELWGLGTSGVATVDPPAANPKVPTFARLLAGFESEAEAGSAQAILGGVVTPVEPTAWDTPDVVVLEVGDRSLTIDAGRSFGHGRHPTTQLCMRALEHHLQPGNSVLDVGCGSGVLSLAAAALGAGAITSIDIDPAAIAATKTNAAANDIELEVAATNIAELDERFDVVVVNMLVSELEPIAGDVRRVARDLIIVSGALIDQRERVQSAFSSALLIEENDNGDWAGDVYRTRDEDPMHTGGDDPMHTGGDDPMHREGTA